MVEGPVFLGLPGELIAHNNHYAEIRTKYFHSLLHYIIKDLIYIIHNYTQRANSQLSIEMKEIIKQIIQIDTHPQPLIGCLWDTFLYFCARGKQCQVHGEFSKPLKEP